MYQSKFLSHLRCNTTAKGITTLLDLIRIIRIICICILLSAAEPADTGISSLCCSAATAPAILGCLHPPWKEDRIFRVSDKVAADVVVAPAFAGSCLMAGWSCRRLLLNCTSYNISFLYPFSFSSANSSFFLSDRSQKAKENRKTHVVSKKIA